MANSWYGKGLEGIADGSISLAGNIRLALVTSGYTVNLATDKFMSTLTADVVARSGNLGSKSYTLGAFSAASGVFVAVTGSAAAYVVIYQDNGSDATSRLIGYLDTVTGLPVTPTGSDISVDWSGAIAQL